MDFFNRDMYEQGLKFQQSIMDQYLDAVKKTTDFFQRKPETEEEQKTAYNVFTQTTEEMMKNAGEVQKALFSSWQESMERWADFFRDADGFPVPKALGGWKVPGVSDTMDQFMRSMTVYQKLFRFWQESMTKLPDLATDPAAATAFYMEKSGDLMKELSDSVLTPLIPEDLSSIWSSWTNLGSTVTNFNKDFFAPWMDRQENFMDCFRRAASGDTDAYGQYMDLLKDAYQESYGSLFQMNGVSMAKDQMSMVFHLLDSYIRTMLSSFQMMTGVQKILEQANQELWSQIRKTMEESDGSMTFKDFYDMWIRINSNAINNFYFTDEFATFMGEYANHAYDFKKNMDTFLESLLSSVPVPTNTEMKSLYKTVYRLRKEVRELQQEIAALKAGSAEEEEA